MLKGIPVSPGIGFGRALIILDYPLIVNKNTITDPGLEKVRFNQALATAVTQNESLKDSAAGKIGTDKARVFEAHIKILQDPQMLQDVHSCISNQRINAESALQTVLNKYADDFRKIVDPYLRERIHDLYDIGQRLIRILTGTLSLDSLESNQPLILIAKYLAPSELIQANPGMIAGLVTEDGGATSHTAIIARSLGIPAVTGVKYPPNLKNYDLIIIDGTAGDIMVNPNPEITAAYHVKQRHLAQRENDLLQNQAALPRTADGENIKLSVNIDGLSDITTLSKTGITGVGLFRTESLFLRHAHLPSEAEQFAVYKEVLAGWSDKPVTLRTLDIGGDKTLPTLSRAGEINPRLGQRGLQLCLDQRDVFETQLRAILKASVYGNLKILFPMVGSLEEFRTAQCILNREKKKLRAAGIPFTEKIPVGVMIETPGAALLTDLFAREADFFSIGTNDLIQYTLAVDRMNATVAHQNDAFHPAVLRLIQWVVVQAHQAGKPVGICGEMAAEIRLMPLLLGLGLDEFSLNPASLPAVKKVLSGLNRRMLRAHADDLLSQVFEMGTAAEVRGFLEEL